MVMGTSQAFYLFHSIMNRVARVLCEQNPADVQSGVDGGRFQVTGGCASFAGAIPGFCSRKTPATLPSFDLRHSFWCAGARVGPHCDG